MIPLHDDNPTVRTPVVTVALIVVAGLAFLWQVSLGERGGERAVYSFGFIPALLFTDKQLPAELAVVPPFATILTSMFMHGGWLHIIGNMLYLWVFGNNVEDAMGHARFVVFYLLCGGAAAFSQALVDPASTIPMIGASGAVAGVLGAYLILHPRAKVLTLLPLGLAFPILHLPAMVVLGIWFVMQFVNAATSGGGPGVAWWAHIGGFVAGVALIFVFRERQVALFDRDRDVTPRYQLRYRPRGPWDRPRDGGGPWG
ncbi:MAG: rhomboid family intramembrane serine protease [Alphaproteobacteria bacterium]|nr:rhomboid family intramembrane serine protease [Alphaproteobacteria bacterium]